MTSPILLQIFWSAIAVAAAILIQVAGFNLIILLLRRWKARGHQVRWLWRATTLGTITYLLFVLHLVQILAYGLVYYVTGAIPSLRTALYFSAATFTTIGGSEVRTEEPWQLFAALQGLSGIVLVGASVSFLVAVVHSLGIWADDIGTPPKR